jgi:hypothetical protein
MSLRNLALATLAGVGAGLAVRGLPAASLAFDAYRILVTCLVALVVIPLAVGQITDDRAGGYEQLKGSRPIASVSWTLGRLVGCGVGAMLLALIISACARELAASRSVPWVVTGRTLGTPSADVSEWRFDMPLGIQGPFELTVSTWLPMAGSGRLSVVSRRGESEERRTVQLRVARRHTLQLSDQAPARGGLYVTLRTLDGLVLGNEAPRLTVGMTSMRRAGLGLTNETLARLGFALLAALSFASAFRFETACLAGLLALAGASRPESLTWVVVPALLVGFAVLGTSLVRRQALP